MSCTHTVNRYRLIVSFDYRHLAAYIKFFGTHAKHDSVDGPRWITPECDMAGKQSVEIELMRSGASYRGALKLHEKLAIPAEVLIQPY